MYLSSDSEGEDAKPDSVKSELNMIEFNYASKSEALKAKNLRRKRRQESGDYESAVNN